MEFLEAATWVTIGKIILIDILLAGDNAVVIGMAAGKLAPELQKKAVIWGTIMTMVLWGSTKDLEFIMNSRSFSVL